MRRLYCGYLIALGPTAALSGIVVGKIFFHRSYDPSDAAHVICFLPACTLFAGGVMWIALAALPSFKAAWQVSNVRIRTPWWYSFVVGTVCGLGTGLVVGPLVEMSRGPLYAWFLTLIGPFPGVLWVLQRRRDPLQADYEDQMPKPTDHFDRAVELQSLSATESFGRHLGSLLFPNAVVALIGPLGAGKTQLSRAIAEGLGIANPAAVTSPTFTLIHEYPARLPIYHFDAYRLNGPNEFLDLGVSEYFEAGGVCLIEWADKVESALPAERLTIRIEVVDENRRKVELIPAGERYKSLTASVR